MALDKELLSKDESLKGLSDEQIAAIVTLSQNDEKVTFGAKFGQIYSEMDEAIKGITGVSKNTNEKTTDYLKRMMSDSVSKGKDLQAKIDTLEKDNAGLKDKIEKGSNDVELKNQLATKEATIRDLTNKFNAKSEELKNLKDSYAADKMNMRISADIASAMSGIQFKEGFTEEILAMAKDNAMAKVKSSNPKYISGADGREVLAFYDEKGAEMRNPDNQLNLYTAADLLRNEFKRIGILADDSNKGGAGSHATSPKSVLNIGAASTKAEAYDIIKSALLSRGLVKGTYEYQQEEDKLYAENAEIFKQLK